MSWKRNFRLRAPISAVNTAGAGTVDVDVVIPADWDEFWDVIDASGLELRVTSPDGYTTLNYSVDNGSGGAFDRTNKLGRLRIDGAATPAVANECLLFWVYYDSTSTQGTGAVATTIASALTGYIERGQPNVWIAVAEPPTVGRSTPRHKFAKSASEDLFCFLNVTGVLERRSTFHADHAEFEEPRSIIYEVQLSSSEAAQASMIDTAATRWIELRGPRGRQLFARLRVKAGTTALNYTLVATVPTIVPLVSTTHKTPIPRVGFRVKNVLET